MSIRKYWHNAQPDGVTIKGTYYPINPGYKEHRFSIEFSLPIALHGNNVWEIKDESEVQMAIDRVNGLLKTIPEFPIIDIAEGELARIDLCYNHNVGGAVQDYRKYLSNLGDCARIDNLDCF